MSVGTRDPAADDSLVSWAEVQDVELVILRRMQELAIGTHPSLFQGTGHDLAGLRDWQPGDRLSSIDWAQSTLTNFSPLITREFDQESNAPIMIAADVSASTRCGVDGAPIAKVVAHAVATFAMAASFFQDRAGLITFDGDNREMSVRPLIGQGHAMHCVEAYQARLIAGRPPRAPDVSFAGLLRKRSLVPVISDFLFDEPAPLLAELADLGAFHDVFLVMVDSAFAFQLPQLSAGWVEVFDVETGRARVLAADDLEQLGQRVTAWQDGVEREAQNLGLEVLRLGGDAPAIHDSLVRFLLGRRRVKR
jgi:uncharacterized protein (DUF58 family)